MISIETLGSNVSSEDKCCSVQFTAELSSAEAELPTTSTAELC